MPRIKKWASYDSTVRENIRLNLIRLTKRKNLKQKDLAEFFGICSGTVSEWFLGKSAPDVERLAALRQLLDCKIEDFFVDPEFDEKAEADA